MLKKILLFILLAITPALAEIKVSFNPEEIHLGESTELTLESRQAFSEMPDLSALTGVFALAGQKNDPYIQKINGRNIKFYRLVYNLFPRQEGQLSSDGITLNHQLLPKAELMVLPPLNKAELPIQIESFVSQDKFYPNETFFYTIKLTDGVGLMSGKMTEPIATGASIQLLDSLDRVYQEYIDDKPVQITERTYAITPLSEGPLTIQPIEVYGKILSKKQTTADLYDQGILFDGNAREWREIRLETKPIYVTILPHPSDWAGWWLPATQVALEVEDNFPETIQVGDSLNRKIILKAVGTLGDYLPKLSQTQSPQLRIYASSEERSSIQTPVGDVQGVETMEVVLVPGQSGAVKIPAIQIPWYNTKTLKREVALIPEKIIQVQGNNLPTVAPTTVPIVQPVQKSQPKALSGQKTKQIPKVQKATEPQNKKTEVWIFIGLGLLGVGLAFFIWHHRKPKSYLLPQPEKQKRKKERKPLQDLYPF